MNLDNIEVTIEGIQTQEQMITVVDNSNILSTTQISNVVQYDITTQINNTNIDVNLEIAPNISEITLENNQTLLTVDVNIIKEESLYELTFNTISVSGDVSQASNNRLVSYSDGFYVPELTLDLVAIYNAAKA